MRGTLVAIALLAGCHDVAGRAAPAPVGSVPAGVNRAVPFEAPLLAWDAKGHEDLVALTPRELWRVALARPEEAKIVPLGFRAKALVRGPGDDLFVVRDDNAVVVFHGDEPVQTIASHDGSFVKLEASWDGRMLLVSTGPAPTTYTLIDRERGAVPVTLSPELRDVHLTRSGAWLVSGLGILDRTGRKIWDRPDIRPQNVPRLTAGEGDELADTTPWAEDGGNTIAIATGPTVAFFDTAKRQIITAAITCDDHWERPVSDGKRLAVGCDHEVVIAVPRTRKVERYSYPAHDVPAGVPKHFEVLLAAYADDDFAPFVGCARDGGPCWKIDPMPGGGVTPAGPVTGRHPPKPAEQQRAAVAARWGAAAGVVVACVSGSTARAAGRDGRCLQ